MQVSAAFALVATTTDCAAVFGILKAAGVCGQHEGRYQTHSWNWKMGGKAGYDTHCTVGVVTSFLPKRKFEEHAFQRTETQTTDN